MNKADLFGLREGAAYLGVSKSWMFRLLVSGKMPAFRVGAAWIIERKDLDAYREANPRP